MLRSRLPELSRSSIRRCGAASSAGRSRFYGITALYCRDKRPFLTDLALLFEWLRQGKLQPRIHAQLPLLAAAEGGAMLERGGVQGKIVHLASVSAGSAF